MTFILTFITVASLTAYGQTKNNAIGSEQAIQNIKFVFDDYIKYQESTDSKDDKNLMTQSLKLLTIVTDKDELDLLINVWMYYEPTDYPDIPEIYRILKDSRPQSIEAVKNRMNNKKEWETDETAPYSELKDLLKQLDSEKKGTLDLLQGFWIHTQDSLASININKYQWTFNYSGQKNNLDDIYIITITDKLPEFAKETEKAEFLILNNKTDTLQYEILGLTDTTLSLLYFPSGKIHLYRRQK